MLDKHPEVVAQWHLWRSSAWLQLSKAAEWIAGAFLHLEQRASRRAGAALGAARMTMATAAGTPRGQQGSPPGPMEPAWTALRPLHFEICLVVNGEVAWRLRTLRPLQPEVCPPSLPGRWWLARWLAAPTAASGGGRDAAEAVENLLRDTWRVWRMVQKPDRPLLGMEGMVDYIDRVRAWMLQAFEECSPSAKARS